MLLSSNSFNACESHLNCLRFAGKISVSELNCECGGQKNKLKLLWPVATNKREKNRCDDYQLEFIFRHLSLRITHKMLYCVAGTPQSAGQFNRRKQKECQRKRVGTETHNNSYKNQSRKKHSERIFSDANRQPSTKMVTSILLHGVRDRKYCTTFAINGSSMFR